MMSEFNEIFKSKSQILDLISRADDFDETKKIINELTELKGQRTPFYLTIIEFDKILHWKLRSQYYRQQRIRESNTEKLVRTITQTAFSVNNIDFNYETKQRLKMLTKLHGVQIPVASAILTLCYPDKYAVIDFRGWRQVFGKAKEYSNYSTKEYLLYLSIIKQIANKFDLTPQEVDMAVWQMDKENNGRKPNLRSNSCHKSL
jgi:thermostable 8-oxoguanine DNA glycosylase